MANDDLVVDIVNIKDEVIRTATLREAREKRLIYRIVQILIFDKSGRLYLQKRSNNVRYPGYIMASAGGHVDAGETYEIAARRELAEEIGVIDILLELVKVSIFKHDEHTRLVATFRGETDDVCNLNHKEVESGRFYIINEVIELLNGKENISPILLQTLTPDIIKKK